MAGRGVFFAINGQDLLSLLEARSDEEVANLVHDRIEERWEEGFVYEVDKAWEGIDRCLTQSNLSDSPDAEALARCFFGGIPLHWGDTEVISLILPREVEVVSEALSRLDRDRLQRAHNQVRGDHSFLPDFVDDFDYIWGYFQKLPAFFQTAANANRALLFSVD